MPAEKSYLFSIEFAVRDYECDIQGIVNNANYLHYLEHARHEFLISRGISFSGLHAEGLVAVATKNGKPVAPGNLISRLGLND